MPVHHSVDAMMQSVAKRRRFAKLEGVSSNRKDSPDMEASPNKAQFAKYNMLRQKEPNF